jgi:hypothetical protein
MAFDIDTGVNPQPDILGLIPDWFRDTCADGLTTKQIVERYAYHMIGATKNPAKLETVRKHTLAQWQFLRELAAMHPDVFDEFWTSYAERALSFE